MYCWRNETLRGNNKQQQKTKMHFTIIQAETCDKVKIIIIFNNILFFIFLVPLLRKNFIVVIVERENKNEWLDPFSANSLFSIN